MSSAAVSGSAADLNIDEFFRNAARSLLQLYRAFPQPVILHVEDLTGPQKTDEFGLPSAEHRACFAALLWLAAEGYLRFHDTIKQDALDQAVLTERSFRVLHAPVTAGTYGDHLTQLRGALKSRSSTALRRAMLEFLNAER
ncbi:MAG: hypothetical protein AAF918_09360 [Pseudomonadota bacterium]